MIKKTLITTLIAFIAYSAFVAFFAPKWWFASQHQWQDNIIKAQKFIYDDQDSYDNIIVGSSISCRLVMDSLPNTYNLSFSGQSIFDGLEVLRQKNKFPKNIFIEMNFVLRPENENFTSSLNSPILYYPKKILPSLREDKQPIAIIGEQLSFRFTAKLIGKTKSILGITQKKVNNKKYNVFFDKILKKEIENYSTLPVPLVLNQSFSNLEIYIKELKKKGVNIIFFEMPVDSRLNNLPGAKLIRKTFFEYFPKTRYHYVPIPDSIKYKTTDGIHLNKVDALRYTIYLRNSAKNCFQK
jgi:hypothetical protein